MRRTAGSRLQLTVVAIACAHAIVTLSLAAVLNLWRDETSTWATTASGPGHAFTQAIHFELQPPVYFVLLSLWREIDHSVWFARAFSVACGAAFVVLAAALLRRFTPRLHPAWAAAVAASSPTVIWASLEMRLYALTILLSGLLVLTLHDGFLSDPAHRRAQLAHGALAVLALYTQYFLGFLLLGAFALLAITRRWKALAQWVLTMALVAVLAGPLVLMVPAQIQGAATEFHRLSVGGGRLIPLVRRFLDFTYALRAPPLSTKLVLVLGMVMVSAFSYAWLRSRPRPDLRVAGLWVMGILTLVAITVALALTDQPSSLRYYVPALPPLLIAALATAAHFDLRARWARVLAVAAVASGVAAAVLEYSDGAKSGDWRRVAEYLQKAEAPRQLILVFGAADAATLAVYYAGPNVVVGLPSDMNWADVRTFKNDLLSEAELEPVLARVPADGGPLWAVLPEPCDEQASSTACQILGGWFDSHFVELQRQGFRGSVVRKLMRRESGR